MNLNQTEIKIPHLMAPINVELRHSIDKWGKKDYFKLLALVMEIRTILKEIKQRE